MADQLCTLAQVKARLFPNGTTDTNDDTFITELIEEVSSWVQGYTGRKLLAEAGATYTFDTRAGRVLRLARGIRTITSMGVAQSDQPDSGGSYTTVPAADRLLRPKAGDAPEGWPFTEVWLSGAATTVRTFGDAENGCTITGDWGFATTPPDIQAVCIDAVIVAYQSRGSGASSALGASDMALPPWSRYFGKGSPQRATLDRYRWWSV